MNRDQIKKTLRDRKIVITLQLAVLIFILFGLFGSVLFPQTDKNTPNTIDLASVAVTEQTASIPALTDVSVRARGAFVWDVNAQEVLFEKNADETLPLASITKLMTAMLAYELINNDTETTLTTKALKQEGETGLVEGERLSLKNLNRLALISSSNDAAFALAAAVGGALGEQDPAAQFVAGMNFRAEELGLETLNFKNPTGLDLSLTEPGAVGSAKDVSHLLEYILENYPDLLESTQLPAARVYSNSGEYHDVQNTNDALYAIPNLLGSKTGYTDLAGGNLTIVYDAGFNRPIVVTVLGSSYNERFTDVINLVAAVNKSLKN